MLRSVVLSGLRFWWWEKRPLHKHKPDEKQ